MLESPWSRTMQPFQLFGNTWFVGSRPASSHIIATGDGLILLDSGYQERLYLVINSIWQCGFSPYDIKYIILSHGHVDHAAATKALVEAKGYAVGNAAFPIKRYNAEEKQQIVDALTEAGWSK